MSWGLVAVAGATLVSGKLNRDAAKDQTRAQQQATQAGVSAEQQSLALQERLSNQQREDILAAQESGVQDIQQGFSGAQEQLLPLLSLQPLQQARGFLQNPSLINQLPGVQFQQQQGVEALQNAFSRTSGGGLSGAAIKAAQEFGQGFASTQLDQALNRLLPFINLDAQTRGDLANLSTGRGANLANLRIGGATRTAGILGEQARAGTAGLRNIGQIQGTGAINQANINTQRLSNLSGLGGNLANLVIQQPNLFSRQQVPMITPDKQKISFAQG